MLTSFRSRDYLFTATHGTARWRIFRILFGKSDGSIYVSFPYFQSSQGLLSIMTCPAGRQPGSLSLLPGGKVTGHRVKFSHHRSGIAQFSQAGKIRTAIRKQSVPLSNLSGHVFTIQFQGVNGFRQEAASPRRAPSEKETSLDFNFSTEEPPAVKIVGMWYRHDELERRIAGNVTGPRIVTEKPDGRKAHAFLISPPTSAPAADRVLVVTCEIIPLLNPNEGACLTFIGGFDPASLVNDLSRESTFLALSYPAENYENLRHQIGTVDL